MNHALVRRLTGRLEVLSLGLVLVLASAGLAYVAHLTQVTAQSLDAGQPPSVLPLIALSILFAIGGITSFRYAVSDENEAA